MARIEKQQFRNNTDGWIGAVAIGPKGEETGIGIEPRGTVWLSEDEQILTANAPRYPQDNPFIEQTLIGLNPETGAREEYTVTPLVPISEQRFVPASERPIPADLTAAQDAAVAQAAATGADPVLATAVARDAVNRHAQVDALGPDAVPGQPAPAIPADQQPDDGLPPIPNTAPPTDGSSGAEVAADVTPEPQEPTLPLPAAPTPPGADPERTVPADEGRAPADETAAQSPGPASEETGAAAQPAGEAAAGTFASGEEVGTPDAPAAPAPWTPEQG